MLEIPLIDTLKERILVLDMDDTLCHTRQYVVETMVKYYKQIENTERLKEFLFLEGKFPNPDTYPDHLNKDIWKYAISDLNFMKVAKPTSLFDIIFKSGLYLDLYSVKICTHRGWSPSGYRLTKEWLEENAVNTSKVEIITCESKDHPNKAKLLTSIYGEDNYRLIDDNPFHDRTTIHEHDKHAIMYDQINKYDAYQNQNYLRQDSTEIIIVKND